MAKTSEREFESLINQNIECPFNYTGNKYKLLPHIQAITQHVDIDNFYDVFAGGMTVSLNIEAKKIIATDILKEIIELNKYLTKNFSPLFRENKQLAIEVIKNTLFTLIEEKGFSLSAKNGNFFYTQHNQKISKTGNKNSGLDEYNKTPYLALRNEYNNSKKEGVENSLFLYLLLVHSFNYQIRFNSKGLFNMPVGRGDWNVKMQNKLFNYCERMAFKNIVFKQQNFNEYHTEDFINSLSDNDVMYFDPPYLISSAVYNESNGWTENNERELLSLLDSLLQKGKKFVLSNVITHNGIKNNLLSDWIEKNKEQLLVKKIANHKYGSFGSVRKTLAKDNDTLEVIISNFGEKSE